MAAGISVCGSTEGRLAMKDDCVTCPYEKVYAMQFDSVTEDLKELKERVRGLDALLTRGMLLLVANLVGVVITLIRGVM